MDNALAGLENRLDEVKAHLSNLEKQQEAAKIEVEKPFLQKDELREKSARLLELDALLDISNKKEDEPVMDEELSTDEDELSETEQNLHKQKGHSLDETEVR